MVVAISHGKTRGALGEFGQHAELVDAGGNHTEASDHSGPRDASVHLEAVEGLLEQSVPSESCLSSKTRAAVGSCEHAGGQGHGVAESKVSVVGCEGREVSPEPFLDLPEIGALAGEGGTVDLANGGEEVSVVSSETREDRFGGVESEELSADPDGEVLGVGEFGSRRRKPLRWLSTRQKTVIMKMLRSTRSRPPFVLEGLEHHRD